MRLSHERRDHGGDRQELGPSASRWRRYDDRRAIVGSTMTCGCDRLVSRAGRATRTAPPSPSSRSRARRRRRAPRPTRAPAPTQGGFGERRPGVQAVRGAAQCQERPADRSREDQGDATHTANRDQRAARHGWRTPCNSRSPRCRTPASPVAPAATGTRDLPREDPLTITGGDQLGRSAHCPRRRIVRHQPFAISHVIEDDCLCTRIPR